MQTWDIDPQTGDYINVNGVPAQTNSLRVAAYFRLKIKRTKWMYAPDSKYGADYYTVQKRPATSGNAKLESITVKALQPLVDDGRAESIQATVSTNTRAQGIGIDVTITDATGEVEQVTFNSIGS